MAPAHESENIVFNFRKLLSTLPNYAELEQILLFSVNWGKQVWTWSPLSSDVVEVMILVLLNREIGIVPHNSGQVHPIKTISNFLSFPVAPKNWTAGPPLIFLNHWGILFVIIRRHSKHISDHHLPHVLHLHPRSFPSSFLFLLSPRYLTCGLKKLHFFPLSLSPCSFKRINTLSRRSMCSSIVVELNK